MPLRARLLAAMSLLPGLLAGMAALAPHPAAAQDKPVQLKLSHWVPPSHPLQAAIQDWADSDQGRTATAPSPR